VFDPVRHDDDSLVARILLKREDTPAVGSDAEERAPVEILHHRRATFDANTSAAATG
jgi:hypothetical protein